MRAINSRPVSAGCSVMSWVIRSKTMLCRFTHKLRRDIQFIYRLNHYAQVVTENLAECFVDLRSRSYFSRLMLVL